MLFTIPHLNLAVDRNYGTHAGETRLFACTGLFIEWNGCITILTSASLVRDPDDGNKIDENLKVGFPNHSAVLMFSAYNLTVLFAD